MTSPEHYEVVVIGAGMAGLAASIRLAHFGRKVLLLERHNVVGGLNSFYFLQGHKYDVGLHALTNYSPPGRKGTPLVKLLRQLRISRDELALEEQKRSRIVFPGAELQFTNDPEHLVQSVGAAFPRSLDAFARMINEIRAFDDLSPHGIAGSARRWLSHRLPDPLLVEMLLCPLMYYGSAWEEDMDLPQMVTMFKALFLEGFARPRGGVRTILRILTAKLRELKVERRMKCGVARLVTEAGRVTRLILDSGQEISADIILSTIGWPETLRLTGESEASPVALPEGRLSFLEGITVWKESPAELGWGDDTIVFFNDDCRFHYRSPREGVDLRSGVICFPDNFGSHPDPAAATGPGHGFWRLTALASYDYWKHLPPERYDDEKWEAFARMRASARRFLPEPMRDPEAGVVARDCFTPATIEKYTWHCRGAVYGSPEKKRDGRTHLPNLFLAGTDQGFLGIIGALLSGISMANAHVLQSSGAVSPSAATGRTDEHG